MLHSRRRPIHIPVKPEASKPASFSKVQTNKTRTKILTDNKIAEQVNSFNYLGNMISYEKEFGIDNK